MTFQIPADYRGKQIFKTKYAEADREFSSNKGIVPPKIRDHFFYYVSKMLKHYFEVNPSSRITFEEAFHIIYSIRYESFLRKARERGLNSATNFLFQSMKVKGTRKSIDQFEQKNGLLNGLTKAKRRRYSHFNARQADHAKSPFTLGHGKGEIEKIVPALRMQIRHSSLSREQRFVLSKILREGYSMRDLSTEMGVSIQSVSQLFQRAIRKVITPRFLKENGAPYMSRETALERIKAVRFSVPTLQPLRKRAKRRER